MPLDVPHVELLFRPCHHLPNRKGLAHGQVVRELNQRGHLPLLNLTEESIHFPIVLGCQSHSTTESGQFFVLKKWYNAGWVKKRYCVVFGFRPLRGSNWVSVFQIHMIHKMTQIHDWPPEGGSVRWPGTYAIHSFGFLTCYWNADVGHKRGEIQRKPSWHRKQKIRQLQSF